MEKGCTGGWHEDGGSGSFPSKAGYQSVLEWRTLKLEEKLQEEKKWEGDSKGEGVKHRKGMMLWGKVKVAEQNTESTLM